MTANSQPCPACDHPRMEYQRITAPIEHGAVPFMVYTCPACCHQTLANGEAVSPNLQNWLNRQNEQRRLINRVAQLLQGLQQLHRTNQRLERAVTRLADEQAALRETLGWNKGALLHGDD